MGHGKTADYLKKLMKKVLDDEQGLRIAGNFLSR